MPLHDAYARATPYELVFPDPRHAEDLAAKVDEEAAARGADPSDPHQFITLASVAAFVGGLQAAEAAPGAMHRFGALVYHAVHFRRAGRPLYLLTTAAARALVEGSPESSPEPPAPAGYLQLPQHLFWARTDEGAAPESVDGVFWTATPAGVLHGMLATGMRPDRPGLAVVPLPEAPLADAARWLDIDVRGDGVDFANILPGGELDALYSFQAAGEVLKLLARFFALVRARDPGPAAEALGTEADPAGPRPAAQRYVRVTLSGRGPGRPPTVGEAT